MLSNSALLRRHAREFAPGRRSTSSLRLLGSPASLLIAFVNSSHAENLPSPGELTQRDFAPPSQVISAPPGMPTLRISNAPSGADQDFITVGEIVVEGLDKSLAGEADTVLSSLRGTRASAAALYSAAGKIQAVYAAHGFFLTRVVIPPQRAHNGGRIVFRVAEGFIEAIDVQALSPRIRDRVAKMLGRIIGKRRLTRIEFDRVMLLASEVPGFQMQGNLSPAQADLGVTLKITGAYSVADGQVSIDNATPRALGGWETTVSGSFNSALGLGEQFYINAAAANGYGGFGPENPHRTAAFGLVTPVFEDGLRATWEYTLSTTEPLAIVGQLPTDSRYRRTSFRLSYPWLKSETQSLTSRLAIDDIDEISQASQFNSILYHDHLDAVRLGLDARIVTVFGTVATASLDLSQGLPMPGARGAEQASTIEPVSRSGASDTFEKWEASAKLRQTLPGNQSIELSGRAQRAINGPLMNSEKFVIGGPADLSGYDDGFFSGDSGWAARIEWQLQMPATGGPSLTPYVFASRGQVYTLNPTAAETSVSGADSLGIGLRAVLNASEILPHATEMDLEVARATADQPTSTAQTWRLNLSVNMRF